MTKPRELILAALLVLVTTVSYWPVTRCGFVWDDDTHLTGDLSIRDPGGIWKIWFKPLTNIQYQPVIFSSFWVEYRLWRFDPRGYHLVNVGLHLVGAFLVWRILTELRVPGSYVVALIFVVHPVHVESVAWITERKNVLSAVFYLSAALAYMRFCPLDEDRPLRERHWPFYILALLLFVVALLSKSVTCTLPAVLLLLIWWKRHRIGARDMKLLAPMLGIGAAMGLFTAWLATNRVGASGGAWDISFLESCMIAGRALVFYAQKLLWPTELSFVYPRWQIDMTDGWQYLYSLTVIAGAVIAWCLRKRIGRGPLTALLYFGGTLFPALGFFRFYFMRYSLVADHFQYLASLGVITLVVATGVHAVHRIGGWAPKLAPVAVACIVMALGILTWRQTHNYRDEETLWHATLDHNPDAWLAHNNLGLILLDQGKLDEAVSHFDEALRIDPSAPESRNNYLRVIQRRSDFAAARNQLAHLLSAQGKADEAIEHTRKTLQLAKAHFNVGTFLAANRDHDIAIQHYRKALALVPDFADAHYELGVVLSSQGNSEEAISHYQSALDLQPYNAEVHYSLAVAYKRNGRAEQALQHFQHAMQLRPNWAAPWNNMAAILATHPAPEVRDVQRAIDLAKQAAELTEYRNAMVLDTLAITYAAAGQFDRAIATAERAMTLATKDQIDPIRQRLERYRQSKTYP